MAITPDHLSPAQQAVFHKLQQALDAARANAQARLSQQALASARSDILAADRPPLPVFSAKANPTDSTAIVAMSPIWTLLHERPAEAARLYELASALLNRATRSPWEMESTHMASGFGESSDQ